MTDFATRRRTMVDTQIRPSDVTKFPIIDAMLTVPRENFVPDAQREAAYVEGMIDLGDGRSMLEPRTLAKMLDALNICKDEAVLDIAPGLGYSTAVAARMAELVVAVEERRGPGRRSAGCVDRGGCGQCRSACRPAGARAPAEHGPYDVIMIQGGVQQVPDALLGQLKDKGRIACLFVQDGLGVVRIGRKAGDRVSWRDAFNASAPTLDSFSVECAFSL